MKSIYTLAQSRTEKTVKPAVVVRGKGSEMLDSDFAKKKAKQKMIGQTLCLAMVDEAKHQKKDYLVKQIWNTYNCFSKIKYVNGRAFGEYCKNRFCQVCSNNRTAEQIRKYKPIIDKWESPYFVTLTLRSVPKNKLKIFIRAMKRTLKRIIDKQRKRETRKGEFHLMGTVSMECNFNPKRYWYNPHFHILVPDLRCAMYLKKEWLERLSIKFAGVDGQFVRKVGCTERDLIEVIKYGFKIITDPEMDKKTSSRQRSKIYVKAFINVLDAFHGFQLFSSFGFTLTDEVEEKKEPQIVHHAESYEFELDRCNWINQETNEPLSDFIPDSDLIRLLTDGIDIEKE